MELLTPRGHGGVAIVRAADAERALVLERLRTPSGDPIVLVPFGPPKRAEFRLPNGIADDVLVVDRGSLGVEVHLHGGMALLDAVAAAFGELRDPPRSAQQRLLETAFSREQAMLALEQVECDFPTWLAKVARMPRAEGQQELERALARSRIAMALAVPAKLAIVGEQNAGKSTLFNRLVFEERSLAGPLAGLTRDAVTEITSLAGYPYELMDTAGEAEGLDGVDANALVRSRRVRESADLVLLVVAQDRMPSRSDLRIAAEGSLLVASKADRPAMDWPAVMNPLARFHASDLASAPSIRETMGQILRTARGLPVAGPVGGAAAVDAAQFHALLELASDFGVSTA
jgi:small GTP-binding protein